MENLAKHYIAGAWRDDGGAPETSVNPADGTSLGRYVPGNAALAQVRFKESDTMVRCEIEELMTAG